MGSHHVQASVRTINSSVRHTSAEAQETTKPLCWEIFAGAKDVAPFSALLLNKCDGSSWMFTKVALQDKLGKPSGSIGSAILPSLAEDMAVYTEYVPGFPPNCEKPQLNVRA
jgi:hypothetical protein